jgi:hypothetical protein
MNAYPIDRRSFLKYVGAQTTVSAGWLGPLVRQVQGASNTPSVWAEPDGTPAWRPVDYPVPSPGDGGKAASDPARFARYTVQDTLVLPDGFRFEVVAGWGDRFGAAPGAVTFGFNCDFTGLIPMDRAGDFWLCVNHEYISGRPWMQSYRQVYGASLPDVRPCDDIDLLAADSALTPQALEDLKRVCRAGMADLGVSMLHVRQSPDGVIEVLDESPHHKRITGIDPRTPTYSGCGGATTPWGTFLSCEENFQEQVVDAVDAAGGVLRGKSRPFRATGAHATISEPFDFQGMGQGIDPPHDGRDFGWVCEVDPASGVLQKRTALGRFRHENIALRAEPGRPLAAYMGDDRRGGYIWKFVSRQPVDDPSDPSSRALLDQGTLYVARLCDDFAGQWIPMTPESPLRMPEPGMNAMGHVWLPDRRTRVDGPPGGPVAVGEGPLATMSVEEWVDTIESFAARPFGQATLGDLVSGGQPQRILNLDAFLMAGAAGATPTSRPEAIQVHPLDQSIYVAFTDNTGGADGAPDVRIFPDSRGKNSRQYGAIYRLEEDGGDPAATSFRWGRFVSSGEVAEGGGGFACADNLVFDPDGNMWMVCDISTGAHNYPVTRNTSSTKPGATAFRGIFGNNALFMIPTSGPRAGVPHCFAIGPMECELTGLTFTPDGRSLLVAVQHPGELHGIRGGTSELPLQELRTLTLTARDGTPFQQERTVPLGSNFPSNESGSPPKPCVVCITRV